MHIKFRVLPNERDKNEYHLPQIQWISPYFLQISNELQVELEKIPEYLPHVELNNSIWINLPCEFIPECLVKELNLELLSGNLNRKCWSYEYNGRTLEIGKRPLIQGILNVTPDSFSDGGRYSTVTDAVSHALRMVKQGADIIDIGGESTRPGAAKVAAEEEWQRVGPVLEQLIPQLPEHVWVSIDTTKSRVAEKALLAGAHIINDISAMTFDPHMEEIASKFQCPVIMMHMKGTPETMQKNPVYTHLMDEILDYFWERKRQLEKIGIHKLIVDPGIGFGKRLSDNYEILRRLKEFKQLGLPVLLGLSRKSLMWKILNRQPNELDPESAFLSLLGIQEGANIIRVHNVSLTRSFLELFKNFTLAKE